MLDEDTGEAGPEAMIAFRLRNSSVGISLKKEGETTQDGNYTLKGFIDGEYSVTAKAEDYLPDTSRRVKVGEDAENEVAITLKRGGDISGRVLNSAGFPVPGASVELFAMPKAPAANAVPPNVSSRVLTRNMQVSPSFSRSSGGSSVKKVLSDEKGNYTLRGIPPGTNYGLMAAHRDFTSELMEDIEVGDRESLADVDITLRKGGIIRGQILDEDGVGIAGVKVRAKFQPPAVPTDPGGATPQVPPSGLKIQMSGGGAESVYSTENGNYLILRLTAGSYTVSANLDGRLPATQESVEVGEEEVVDDVDIILTRGESVAGVVVDDEGEPIPGAEIRASGGSSPRVTTDLEGAFLLEGLPAQKISARVS